MTIWQKKTWMAFIIISALFLSFNQAEKSWANHFTFAYTPSFVRFWGTLQMVGLELEPGDEIGVFDGTVSINNNCIGSTVIENNDYYVVDAYGDDSSTPEKDGALVNAPLSFKLWKAGENKAYDLEPGSGLNPIWVGDKEVIELNLSLSVSGSAANFTFSPDQGCAPIEVSFTDISEGTVTAWHWDFGDGSTSTLANPSHIFNFEGNFKVTLTVTINNTQYTVNRYVKVSTAPISHFTTNKISGTAPLTVKFADQSQGIPTLWQWNFGDGTTSVVQNPSHTYSDEGTYTVTLTVTNACGDDTKVIENCIEVSSGGSTSGLKASFGIDNSEGCSPLPVKFFDTSTGNPTTWHWDFGDGSWSNERNPSHEYAQPGFYTVKLIVGDGTFESIFERPNLICTHVKPVANFNVENAYVCPNTPVQFTDQTDGSAEHYRWNFGDGESSTDKNPLHIYKTPGKYTIRLTVFSLCGYSVEQKSSFVVVKDPVKVDFKTEQTNTCPNLTVKFTDKSTSEGGGENWLWDFGDGGSSTEANPEYNYTQPGTYEVTLTIDNGCVTNTKTKEISISGAPVADFTLSSDFNPAGRNVQFNDTSIGVPSIWLWDFGDGTQSTAQNPTHVYQTPGKYTVTFGAKNSCDNHVVQKDVLIGKEAEAYFVTDTDTSCTNTLLHFTNISDPVFTTFVWHFSDGTTVNDKNPVHAFESPGTFQVKLIASDAENSMEYTKVMTIEETPQFSADQTGGCAPMTVKFFDLSSTPANWVWDFGDGQSSSEQHPSHTYDVAGTYTVNLSYPNACGGTSKTIKINEPPIADFTVNKVSGAAPLTVTFEDLSTGTATRTWDFGDGETSEKQDPNHTYKNPGFYEVQLKAKHGDCEDEKIKVGVEAYFTGSIKGKILDAISGKPVTGAKVQILGHDEEYFTNSGGDYSITKLRSGFYALRVSATSYETASLQEIMVRSNENTSRDISLNKAKGSISGLVTDNNNNPLPQATVVVLDPNNGEQYLQQAITDQTGKYIIYFSQEGTFNLVASKDGYSPKVADNQGAGYTIDTQNWVIADLKITLDPESWPPVVNISSLEMESQTPSGQIDRQTKITISIEDEFEGTAVSIEVNPELTDGQTEGSISLPQLVDSNTPIYEAIYSDYIGREVKQIGLSIQLTKEDKTYTLPYVFTVNSDSSNNGLCLKGVGQNIVPAKGGNSPALGWLDLDKNGTNDHYDRSFVEIPPCCVLNKVETDEAESVLIRLERILDPNVNIAAAVYQVDLLDNTGELLKDLKVSRNNPLIIHLDCNPAMLGTNSGNLMIKYQDSQGNWQKDGISNVHLSGDMLVFTTTHLTRFALLENNEAPSHLVVQSASQNQLNLTWKDNSENELGFEIWRCVDQDPNKSGNYELIAVNNPDVTTYQDTSCHINSTYNYKIRAVTELGDTAYSTVGGKELVECEFAPNAPANLEVKTPISQVILEWQDNSPCEEGFDIWRKEGTNGVYDRIHSVPTGTTTYTDEGVKAGHTYYYIVKATSNAGDSEASNEIEVVTPSKKKSGGGDDSLCFISALHSSSQSVVRWLVKNITTLW